MPARHPLALNPWASLRPRETHPCPICAPSVAKTLPSVLRIALLRCLLRYAVPIASGFKKHGFPPAGRSTRLSSPKSAPRLLASCFRPPPLPRLVRLRLARGEPSRTADAGAHVCATRPRGGRRFGPSRVPRRFGPPSAGGVGRGHQKNAHFLHPRFFRPFLTKRGQTTPYSRGTCFSTLPGPALPFCICHLPFCIGRARLMLFDNRIPLLLPDK